MGMDNENFHSDPMKSPLFECFLRLHQLNHICTRVPEEYKKYFKKDQKLEKCQIEEPIKSESESEDSFLSADMSADDNVLAGPSKALVEETNQEKNALSEKGRRKNRIIRRDPRH
jgi:hypothetical protein